MTVQHARRVCVQHRSQAALSPNKTLQAGLCVDCQPHQHGNAGQATDQGCSSADRPLSHALGLHAAAAHLTSVAESTPQWHVVLNHCR